MNSVAEKSSQESKKCEDINEEPGSNAKRSGSSEYLRTGVGVAYACVTKTSTTPSVPSIKLITPFNVKNARFNFDKSFGFTKECS